MTITRIINGREVEIELTEEEKEKVYRGRRLMYKIEDVKSEIDARARLIGVPDLTNDDLTKIANKIEDSLENVDTYWEIYWNVVDVCINDYVVQHHINYKEEG